MVNSPLQFHPRHPKKMNKIEIYLHGAGTTEEKIISLPGDATVHDLIAAAKQAGFAYADPVIMVEDGDDALDANARLCDCGVKHKHHVHCHECRKVAVTVNYNGLTKERKFAPAKKVKGVLRWALEAFGLQGPDAEGKELRLGSAEGTVLTAQQHIGSFVRHPHCELQLYLTPIVEVQG
jgi:hypothetical protein